MVKAMIEAMNKQHKLLKTLLCENQNDSPNIILSATTNRAAAVLCELANDPYVRTIHSTLGLALKKNFHTGTEDLVKTNKWRPISDTILIMDEASMLDDTTFAFMNETLTGNSKAVLIGDIFQLAPIKQKRSTMQTMLHNVPTATMTKVLRHGGDILKAATAFREVVHTGCFQDILLADAVIHIDGPTFKQEIDRAFMSSKYKHTTAKILAWSNDRVQEYNNYLRKAKGLGELFQMGETVITNNPIILDGHVIPVDSEVEITWVGDEEEDQGVLGHPVVINNKIYAFLPNNYKNAKTLMKQIAKKANSLLHDNNQKDKKKLWELYFRIKDTWLDLRSTYASTVHKAQGSSYDEVFIDLDDIGRCNIASDTARMLYVAISRGRHRIILSGTLPEKYRSPVTA